MKTTNNAVVILARLKKQLQINTDNKLAEALNVKPNTLSSWKKRNKLDYFKIIGLCQAKEIDLNNVFSDKTTFVESNEDFDIKKITSYFSNIRMANDSDEDTVHFYIENENGSDFAEVMFRPDDRYWRVIKDNFPMPRAGYAFDIPMKKVGQFERYFFDMKIPLIKHQ